MNQPPLVSLAFPYLEGVEKGVLRYQSCLDCGASQTLARYACSHCQSERLAWKEASGKGAVYAVTRVMRAPSESFRALVPYTLVLVTLDEGPRLLAHGRENLAIGDRVVAHTFIHAELSLVIFDNANPGAPGLP